MKKISLVCCLVLLMNLLCPAGVVAHASSTSTDLCSHEWIWQSKDASTCQNICALCGWVSLEEAHMAYCDAPGVCYKCGHAGSMDSTHRGELRWEYNETDHMQIWDCCGEEQYRSYHFASCIGEANVCANCGYIGTMDVLHSNQEMEYNDEVHWEQCLDCGETFGLSSHYASCQAPNKCLDCGYESELIQEITHTNTEWQADNTNCWLYCTACQKEVQESLAPHLALCTVPGECGWCGYKGEIAITHAGDLISEHNDTECWVVCSACNQELENSRALHSASCTNPGVCMGCGYTGEMDISHIGDLNWERTETEHWQVCTACGQTVWGPYEHYAACDNPTVCRDCEYAGPIESIAHIGDLYFEYTDTEHWQTCSDCGTTFEWTKDFHKSNCQTPTQCINCDYEGEVSEVSHVGEATLAFSEDMHWANCSTCGEDLFGPETHYASCQVPGVCIGCGYEKNDIEIVHQKTQWECNDTEHWETCVNCGAITWQPAQHFAYCPVLNVCVQCKYEGDIEIVMHINSQWNYDDTEHWKVCLNCNQEQYRTAHYANCSAPDVCVECGYEGAIEESSLSHNNAYWEYNDQEHWYLCDDCGPIGDPFEHNADCDNPTVCTYCGYTGFIESIYHLGEFVDGKCELCGYAEEKPQEPTTEPTAVPTQEPTTEPTAVPTQEPTTEPTAVPTQAPTTEPTAAPTQEPTTEPTPAPTQEPASEPTKAPIPTPVITETPADEEDEAPVRPVSTATPTATPAPTATPEPVFTQAPENEMVHGVKVEDRLPMVDAMLTVVNTIVTEREAAQIQIVNFDKILTAEENTAITQMKPQEQLLTFLAVVGIQPQASDALSQVQENMSEETSAIQEQIKQRIATMSEAERTAFEDALMEYFPMETVTIDGQEYTWFTIDLEVNVDGVIRIERYGFRLEGESWIFAKLEIST